MDGAGGLWYFSTMSRQSAPAVRAEPARRIDFHRTKYGRELLVDAVFTAGLRNFHQAGRPHSLSFYDLLLITRGEGTFALDGEVHRVEPGVLFFTRPGEIRQWRARGVDGACLFFTQDFVHEAFSDPRFLDQFAYFRPDRPRATLVLRPADRRRFLDRFAVMRREIEALSGDAPHLLRAVLYELLVLLNRWYAERYGPLPASSPNSTVERFEAMVERDFRHRQRVAGYAAELGLSPGHLNALCRRHRGRSAGDLVRGRITLEARRLLLYSDRLAASIALQLGFEDPSFFSRFFRRETGLSPSELRAQGRRALRSPAGPGSPTPGRPGPARP